MLAGDAAKSRSGTRPHEPRRSGWPRGSTPSIRNWPRTTSLVASEAPELLDLHGVGAITAAVILTVWSHPGRIRTEAAFAQIAGTAPIPASSGNAIRHRLNRGGARQLNRALNTIVLTRMRTDPDTRAYIDRRLTEGKTTKEIRRCLKRYVARQIFRTLAAAPHARSARASCLTRHRSICEVVECADGPVPAVARFSIAGVAAGDRSEPGPAAPR